MSAEDPTVREWLTDNLAPLFPAGWKWVPYQRSVDTLDRTTVTYKQSRIVPLAEAPAEHLSVEGVLTVASPRQDTANAEDELDDDVLGLVWEIRHLQGIKFTEATKVAVSDQNLGWDLSVAVITRNPEASSEE